MTYANLKPGENTGCRLAINKATQEFVMAKYGLKHGLKFETVTDLTFDMYIDECKVGSFSANPRSENCRYSLFSANPCYELWNGGDIKDGAETFLIYLTELRI